MDGTLTAEQIKALKRWPRILALTLTGGTKPTVTWKQFCEAQDAYEAAHAALQGSTNAA